MQYRGQLLFWVATDALYIIVLFYVWKAIFATNAEIRGFHFEELVTYYVMVFLVEIIAAHYAEYNMEDIVRNGKLTKYLVRPMSFFWYRLFNEIAWRVSKFVVTFPFYAVVFYLLRNYLVRPSGEILVRFLFTIVFTSLLYFLVSYLISFFAFWLLRISSIVNIFRASLVPLLAGALVPLELFPETFRTVVDFLPFKYLVYFPVTVFLGQIDSTQYWQGLLINIFWIGILGAAVWWLWPRALKKYESVGG